MRPAQERGRRAPPGLIETFSIFRSQSYLQWPKMTSIEGFRLQGDRLLVGRIILVSGEIFFIFMIIDQ